MTVPLPEVMEIWEGRGSRAAYAVALVVEWLDPSMDPHVFAISTSGISYRITPGEFHLLSSSARGR